jgi:RNA polymerase sigma-70 factor (ECF subfamily)
VQINAIIAKCRRLDPQAQRELYDLYRSKLWSMCLRYSREPIDADDIFQEAFLRVFRQMDTLKDDAALDGWIRKILVRTAINFYKSQKRHWQHEPLENGMHLLANDEEDIIGKLNNDQLLGFIQQLPDGYRMVFNLYVIDGFNHDEIAELLGISAPTSRANLSRAKAWLRHKLIEQKIFLE